MAVNERKGRKTNKSQSREKKMERKRDKYRDGAVRCSSQTGRKGSRKQTTGRKPMGSTG